MTATAQLRRALEALRQEAGDTWTGVLAVEVVRLGGADAVDLMHLALDDAIDVCRPRGTGAELAAPWAGLLLLHAVQQHPAAHGSQRQI